MQDEVDMDDAREGGPSSMGLDPEPASGIWFSRMVLDSEPASSGGLKREGSAIED